jgi:hypothetical protein
MSPQQRSPILGGDMRKLLRIDAWCTISPWRVANHTLKRTGHWIYGAWRRWSWQRNRKFQKDTVSLWITSGLLDH